MRIDGSAVHYFLDREFDDVEGVGLSRTAAYDYPLLFDSVADVSGHVVLVPEHERPARSPIMDRVLCVCVGDESAAAARAAGFPLVQVGGDVTFQHLYNRMQEIFVRNERLDARLRTLVDAHADFSAILEACSQAWSCSCALVDDQYRLVCQCEGAAELGAPGHSPFAEMVEADSVDLFMASREYRHMRSTRSVFAVPGSTGLLMKNVFLDERLAGILIAQHAEDVLSARFARFVLNYVATFVEELLRRVGSIDLATPGSSLVKRALEGAIEGGDAAYGKLRAALTERGHGPESSYLVLRISRSFTNEGSTERGYLANRFEMSLPRSYCFEVEDDLFMLVTMNRRMHSRYGTDLPEQVPIVARDNLAKVGMSRTFNDITGLPEALVQAQAAFEQGSLIDPTMWVYRFDDYAFTWLLNRARGDLSLECICHPAIPVLMRYDAAHGTDLLGTLRMFMESRYNASLTAERLFVARSTLLHRLDRIEQLTGLDLDDSASRSYLVFSLSLLSAGN